MDTPFRIIDTGVRDGRRQIAFDQALIELHKAGRVPDTIRFLRFPPTVLIGRHQAMSHEVNVAHCREMGIGLVRRITGGGAIYLDQGQIGWEIILSRSRLPMSSLADYSSAICEAIAHGLRTAFGIDARFRPRSDIEVDGRKLCGTGGFFDGDTLIYQGTVLADVDPATISKYLNLPEARPAERALDAAASRLTTLKLLLGAHTPATPLIHEAIIHGLSERLGIVADASAPTADEERLADHYHAEEIGTDRFTFEIDDPSGPDVASAKKQTPGGTIAAYVRLDRRTETKLVRELLLTGDFFLLPPRLLFDLEANLRGTAVSTLDSAVTRYFDEHRPAMSTISPDEIRHVVVTAAHMEPTR